MTFKSKSTPAPASIVNEYDGDLYAQADGLERKADMLRSSLLAPSMREEELRRQAAHLRAMAA
jgi:hypothetical protein